MFQSTKLMKVYPCEICNTKRNHC